MAKYATQVRKVDQVLWGYEVDPNDEDLLLPIEAHLDVLYEALDQYRKVGGKGKGLGFRKFADYVSAKTKSSMSYITFRNKWLEYKENKYRKPLSE